MFYRLRRGIYRRRLDRAIAGVLDTPPLTVQDAPWSIVSMVANHDLYIYMLAIKSFYAKLGKGKIVAIVDRDMPTALRDTMAAHLVGIEFVTLEDISTTPCQRGGTWERLLYCLDRSESEYTIQLDSDTLTVGPDLHEVIECLKANRAFTMSDGFSRMRLSDAAEMAQATPSNYVGIVSEAAFDRYPGGETLHYVRGSSGFAGFAKGGFTRAAISDFHRNMERLVGEARWREWGSEQCGSNFAIANSPDPLVLPYPEYASFNPRVLRREVKLFHFIGSFRFWEGYYARRGREVIATLTTGADPPAPQAVAVRSFADRLPLLFARNLTPGSGLRYLWWRIFRRHRPIVVQMRARREFRDDPAPGPKFRLRPKGASSNNDYGVAYEIFLQRLLMPPVWIPPERVKLIVDLGANVGMSCLWWLANYWRAQIIAFEPHPHHAAEAGVNIGLNGYGRRIALRQTAVGPESATARISDAGSASTLLANAEEGFATEVVSLFEAFAGQRIDLLKSDIEGSEVGLLDDPRFGELDIGAVVLEWHTPDGKGRGGRDWCVERLQRYGFRTYVAHDNGEFGMLWGYRG